MNKPLVSYNAIKKNTSLDGFFTADEDETADE